MLTVSEVEKGASHQSHTKVYLIPNAQAKNWITMARGDVVVMRGDAADVEDTDMVVEKVENTDTMWRAFVYWIEKTGTTKGTHTKVVYGGIDDELDEEEKRMDGETFQQRFVKVGLHNA